MRMLSAALLVVLSLACASSPHAAGERGIRAQYDVLERAFANRDTAAVLGTRAADFETFGPGGERNDAAQMAEYTRQWFITNQPPITVHFTMQQVRWVSDDEAVVTVLQQATRYQDLAGKRRLNRHSVVQDETWIRSGSTWKIRKVENIRDKKRWIDEKRVDPSKPYDPDAPPFTG